MGAPGYGILGMVQAAGQTGVTLLQMEKAAHGPLFPLLPDDLCPACLCALQTDCAVMVTWVR